MKRLILTTLLLGFSSPLFAGDDADLLAGRQERDRKARVALALAGIGKPSAAVPAPKPKAQNYPDAYKKAVANTQPLVMFVGVELWPVRGAVVAQAPTFADVKAPAVVVGYPVADRLYIHATFAGDATPKEVQASADAAALKIDAPTPKAMPAPVPLDWQIRLPARNSEPGTGTKDPEPGATSSSSLRAPNSALCAARDALVRVRCGNEQGSGTVIWSENGQSVVLTAAHVVSSGGALSVRGNGKTYPAQILGRDEAADLAALLVGAEMPAVKVATADPLDGADVLLVGMTSIWSKGKLDRREEWRGGETYLLGAGYESDNGDSGGGVFVGAELVGVHCGKVSDTPTSTRTPYAVGAKPIRSFLARIFKRNGARLVPVAVVPAPAPAQPMAGSSGPKLVGYRQVCDGRRCVWVPVYEP